MTLEWSDINVREQEILKLAVNSYIQTAQPVSSLYLVEHNQIPFSSATIRSIFVDLENKLYLFSPHRSSGRIPTEKAYRFYVETLGDARPQIEGEERTYIQKEYLSCPFSLSDLLEGTSRILSGLTNYTGVVIAPQAEESVLKHIELLDMGEDEVLVVIVTRSGSVFHKTLVLEQRIPPDYLQKISRILNELYKGMELGMIKEELYNQVKIGEDIQHYFSIIARTIVNNFDSVKGEEELYTYGEDRLYSCVGSSDVKAVENIGKLFSSRKYLRSIFRKAINLDEIHIMIDGDKDERLAGLSIVAASYKMGEKKIGSLGIVGPNRMDYTRTISIVEYISVLISNMITRMSN